MTTQETIRLLKMEMLGDSEQMECAKKIAVEALNKQIPKKIICEVVEIKSEVKQGYIRYLKCPNCKRNIDEENTVHFCTYCGQALDWSDEK